MPNEYTNICHRCPHSTLVPGSSHHQSCNMLGDPMIVLLSMHQTRKNYLEIQANDHGIKNGWFNWPINFDPCWLEHCLFAKAILLEEVTNE